MLSPMSACRSIAQTGGIILVMIVLCYEGPSNRAVAGFQRDLTPTLSVDSTLVRIPFHVRRGRGFADDIRQEDVVLFEDGKPQQIAVFEPAGRRRGVETEIALLFDCSSSIRRVSGQFSPYVFDQALLRRYESVSLAVYGFSEEWRRFTTATRDMTLLNKAVADLLSVRVGKTLLYPSLIEVIRDFAATAQPNTIRAIAVFTDGVAPPAGQLESIRVAQEKGIAVYPVVFPYRSVEWLPSDLIGRRRQSQSDSPGTSFSPFSRALEALGPASGGRAFRVLQSGGLGSVLEGLIKQLDSQYLVGFYPKVTRSDRPHKVEVVINDSRRGKVENGKRDVRY
jgi:VWFA-related protein